jgi:hypothetical protein
VSAAIAGSVAIASSTAAVELASNERFISAFSLLRLMSLRSSRSVPAGRNHLALIIVISISISITRLETMPASVAMIDYHG